MEDAERAFTQTPIYQEMRRRRNALRAQYGPFSKEAGTIDVTVQELNELEAAAPVWMRFMHVRDGVTTFSLGPFFATEFRVVEHAG